MGTLILSSYLTLNVRFLLLQPFLSPSSCSLSICLFQRKSETPSRRSTAVGCQHPLPLPMRKISHSKMRTRLIVPRKPSQRRGDCYRRQCHTRGPRPFEEARPQNRPNDRPPPCYSVLPTVPRQNNAVVHFGYGDSNGYSLERPELLGLVNAFLHWYV